MRFALSIISLLLGQLLYAQDATQLLVKGNKEYTAGRFEEAAKWYEKALAKDPANQKAAYNYSNSLFKKQQYQDAASGFEKLASESKALDLQQHSLYNQGVALTRDNKLEESIEAYKKALLLDPADADARHNLQKALLELKKKQPPEKPKDDKQQQQKKQQKPKQQQSKLNKKQVENLLKALQQKEQDVQKRAQQNRTRASSQPEKDW